MGEKKELRVAIQKRLSQINDRTHFAWSKAITKKLVASPLWKKAKKIGVTLPFKHEIDTTLLVKIAWQEGKTIALPKCNAEKKEMHFRKVRSFNELEKGYGNILEPMEAKTEFVPAAELDLVIVPGMLFDKQGNRLGYGGGFYDRFLSTYTGKTVSLAFECMVVSEIPAGIHDIPVQTIITNTKVYQL